MADVSDGCGSLHSEDEWKFIEKQLDVFGNIINEYDETPVLSKKSTLFSHNRMTRIIIPEFLEQLKSLSLQLVLNEPNHLRFKTSADIDLLEKGLSEMGLNCFHSYSGTCKRGYVVEVRDYHGLANITAQLSYGVKKTEKQRSIIGTFLDIYVSK